MKIKIILILLFAVLLLNNVNAESNPLNVTIQTHQTWDFFSETDASVTEIIIANENWSIPGSIGLSQNAEIVDYFEYIDNPDNPPYITIYRPTVENRMEVPDLLLTKNKTLIRKYTFLKVSTPINNFSFPFDEYDFSFWLPVKEYNQKYHADIIFPASFEIKNVTIIRPFIEQQINEGWTITLAGIHQKNKIPESKSIEEYKYKAYIPLIEVPNSFLIGKYTGHIQGENKNFLILKYTYGRPELFIMIFYLSVALMLLVTILSLIEKVKFKEYLLTMGSIWSVQEGVSFLQGHRPLDWTFYDNTIFVILIYIIYHLFIFGKSPMLNFKALIEKRIQLYWHKKV